MRRRAMTLLETVLALALLASLAAAALAWSSAAVHSADRVADHVALDSATSSLTRLISDELMSVIDLGETRIDPLVISADGTTLTLRCRDVVSGGEATVRYTFDRRSGVLSRESSRQVGLPRKRLLLTELADVSFAIDDIDDVLRITLTSEERLVTRMIPLDHQENGVER